MNKKKRSTTIAQAAKELERMQARTLQSFALDRLLYALKEVNDTIAGSSNPIAMQLLYNAALDLIAALGVGDISSSGAKVKIKIRRRGTTCTILS